MSFATSAKFDLTVLLWGDQWWLPDEPQPLKFDHPSKAASTLAAHFANVPKPVRLRLVYQPDVLTTAEVACPDGNRATVAAALSGEFSSLVQPEFAWSHEPILASASEPTTLLHYEREALLNSLADQLTGLGLIVATAWPLATFLQALPMDWTESGAVTLLAVSAERALAYRHPADGVRLVKAWRGVDTVAKVTHWLEEILRASPEEPTWLITGDDDVTKKMMTALAVLGPKSLQQGPIATPLGKPLLIPAEHPAQLLRGAPRPVMGQLMMAASIALLFTAGWLAVSQMQAHSAWVAQTQARAAQATALRAEIAHLRQNQTEIERLRSIINQPAGNPPLTLVLRQLAAGLPPEIVLSSIKVEGRAVSVAGYAAPGSAPELWQAWTRRIDGGPFLFHTISPPGISGQFTLKGEVRT